MKKNWIGLNIFALTVFHAKKQDKPELLSRTKLSNITSTLRTLEGDIHDKAVFLMKSLVQQHPFASGNRKIAFLAAKDFLLRNKAKFAIKDDPSYSKSMIGIRERFYSDEEIKLWLKTGEINEFKR